VTRPSVIDTNVLRVAENVPGEWSPSAVERCVAYLLEVQTGGTLVIDDLWLILSEYAGEVSASQGRQSGVGARFLQWAYQVKGSQDRCEAVSITPRLGSEDGDFVEFPDDPDLAKFHRKDRKFVAVARGSKRSPEIANATDSDWWEHREALRKHGVAVRFLCPELFGAKADSIDSL